MSLDLPDKCIVRQPGVGYKKYYIRGGEWSIKKNMDLTKFSLKFTGLTLSFFSSYVHLAVSIFS